MHPTALLALDLAHEPEATVAAAAPWLSHLDARVHAAWADPHTGTAAWVRFTQLASLWEDAATQLAALQLAHLRELIATLPHAQQGDALVLDGDPADALTTAGQSFDLLVIGTNGPHHTLSAAGDRILRSATVPVLVARPNPVPSSPRVLIAVDARSGAEALVAAALPWLRQLDARVEIVHVEDTIPAAWADALPVHDHDGPPAEERLLLDEAMTRLTRSVHAALPVRASVARGVPHKVIRELAADHDLVVVGTCGRRGLARLWLGSVTERVARDCPVSLLVFHL